MPEANGSHMLTTIDDTGRIYLKCRWADDAWRGIYGVSLDTVPKPRIYFSRLFDPTEW